MQSSQGLSKFTLILAAIAQKNLKWWLLLWSTMYISNYISALKGTDPDYFEVVRYSLLQELPEVKSSKGAEKQ